MKVLKKIITLSLLMIVVVPIMGFAIVKASNDADLVDEKEIIFTEENVFEEIHFELSNSDIEVLPGNDNEIKIIYNKRENINYKYSVDENTIKLVESTRFSVVSCSGIYFERLITQIFLPSSWNGDLNLTTSNGKISVSGFSNLSIINLKNKNGSIILNNVLTTRYIKMKTTNGSIDATNVVTTSYLNCDTINGAITLTDVKAQGDIDLETTNNVITLTRVLTPNDIDIENINNLISCSNIEAKDMTFSNKNGPVNMNGIKVSNLNGKTSNNSINVSMIGKAIEYNIELLTSNGAAYLNDERVSDSLIDNNADFNIYLKTSNSSINLKISEK